MNFKKFGILFLSLTTLSLISSCSKEDGEPSSDSITNFDGERLTGINDANFYYDNRGRLIEVSDPYDTMTIDYSKGTFTLEDEVYGFKTNSDGYISEITNTYDDIDGWNGNYYQYTGKGKYTFTYSNGVITKINVTYSETEKNLTTNEVTKYESEGKYSLSWKSNMLTSINIQGKETEDGETDRWEDNYSISYSQKPNVFRQYPITIVGDALYFDFSIACMASVGLLGKGPSMLPDYIEGNDDSYYWDTNLNFSLTASGAIKKEITDRDSYTYYYNSINSRSLTGKDNLKEKSHRRIFGKRLKEKRK